MSNIKVEVRAEAQPDGSVRCAVGCNGQEAVLIFDGQDVLVEVHEPAAEGPA